MKPLHKGRITLRQEYWLSGWTDNCKAQSACLYLGYWNNAEHTWAAQVQQKALWIVRLWLNMHIAAPSQLQSLVFS